MTKHTKTPWVATKPLAGQAFYYIDPAGEEMQYGKIATCWSGGDNANHIVHCVNMHDELVEALENIMRFVQTKGEPYLPRVDAIEAAKSAIKKAKGTK